MFEYNRGGRRYHLSSNVQLVFIEFASAREWWGTFVRRSSRFTPRIHSDLLNILTRAIRVRNTTMFKFTSLVPNPFASRPPPPSSPEGPPAMETPPPPFPFMRLPLELREQVYSIYFHPGSHLIKNSELEAKSFFGGVYQWDFGLLRVNKQVYEESKKVWKRENVFVKIATPWPSAGMYRVYLMASDGFTDGGPCKPPSIPPSTRRSEIDD
jgi:hypothetical protein